MSPAFLWSSSDIAELENNYLDEKSSKWLYLALADTDPHNERAHLLRDLAEYEEKHASLWEGVLKSLSRPLPPIRVFPEHRTLVRLAKLFGIGTVLPILHKGEVDGIAKYKAQAARWQTPAAQAALNEILPDEIVHEVDTFGMMRQAGASGGVLRSAILGANDGLGSILALVAGVAGATHSSPSVVIAGIAGLVAGMVSMAASNYVSVKAEQELYETQVRLLKDALSVSPDVKKRQLVQAYVQKGLNEEEASQLVNRLAQKPAELLKALLAEVHGISDTSFQNPLELAIYTGAAFGLAGLVPLVPFFFLPAGVGTLWSVALTGLALFVAGVVRALSTLNSFMRSGIEMLFVGLGSAAATYLTGLWLGTTVG